MDEYTRRAHSVCKLCYHAWKDSFWSDSYFLTTTGGANIETLEQYIQQQGIKKSKRKYAKRK